MMLNDVIILAAAAEAVLEKMFFEIVALHSYQLTIRLKHLVTTCNLCNKSVALQRVAI